VGQRVQQKPDRDSEQNYSRPVRTGNILKKFKDAQDKGSARIPKIAEYTHLFTFSETVSQT
jgi:hypothetical protein